MTPDSFVGRRLGRYNLLSLLGAGGMGNVYRAHDTRLDREVAIKILPAHLTQDAVALARFHREAQAVAALSHPNVLAIHDVGEEEGVHYAVAELLDGETLRSRLVRGALPWHEAVRIAAAVAQGLAATHAKGIVHRDLKPDNVFLARDGRVKILDFGLARRKPSPMLAGSGVAPALATLTEPGVVLGTIGYMSPEQLCGEPVDERSDVFSFGCVLYEMVSGTRAFARQSVQETAIAILQDAQPPLLERDQHVPPHLRHIVDRCLRKAAGERYQSTQDLALDLEGLLTDSAAPVIASGRSGRRVRAAVWGAATMALLGVGPVLYQAMRNAPSTDGPIDSIAVLPLVNASGDPDMEYLTDGITEGLINSLSQVSDLRVLARTTVFRYKGQDADPLEVGSALKVRAVLTGRVLLRGNDLSIQADLMDVATGAQLWGERYNQKLTDLIALQSVIASRITDGLHLRLPNMEQRRVTRRHTENIEAYQLYLRGRREATRLNREGRENAVGHFRRAIQLDPGYALAYAGLAEYYVMYPHLSDAVPARQAALKALELDESLAEAHSALANVSDFYDWDWAQAEREHRRAIALNPGSASAHHWYGTYLAKVGRLEEAEAELLAALRLDPLAVPLHQGLGRVYYQDRRYDKAAEMLLKALELDPDNWLAHVYLALTWQQLGRHEQALAQVRKATGPSAYAPDGRAWLVHGLVVADRRAEARRLLAQLQPHEQVPWSMAAIHTALGDRDQAFAWLDRAASERFGILASITTDPVFDGLRQDPRYLGLLQRLRLRP